MTYFELTYLLLQRFMPTLWGTVNHRLVRIARSCPSRPHILDVGGRKSHYTIGVPAQITISDLPRDVDIQHTLNLGITPSIVKQIHARRSNVHRVLLDDMTRSSLADCSFDVVVAVEVLEHVEQDVRFVREVNRVLKPGGIFLMTTPNGDFVENRNPDHKRHYKRDLLSSLLSSSFGNVEVCYAVQEGLWYRRGLKSWSLRRPCRTALSMLGNYITSIRSAGRQIAGRPLGTRHLVACGVKQTDSWRSLETS